MGNCSTEYNHNSKTPKNPPSIYNNQNNIQNNYNSNTEEINNLSITLPIPETQEVYKISRKTRLKKKNIYQNNFFRVNTNTDNSTYSKSKNTPTELSENNLSSNIPINKFNLNSRIKTLKETKSNCSFTLSSLDNHFYQENNNKNNFNKKFNEVKAKIRRKIHSTDKALPTTTEETLNKILENKEFEKNIINNNGITILVAIFCINLLFTAPKPTVLMEIPFRA